MVQGSLSCRRHRYSHECVTGTLCILYKQNPLPHRMEISSGKPGADLMSQAFDKKTTKSTEAKQIIV